MKKYSFLLLCLFCALFSQAQVALTGTVKDALSGLGLPGAAVIYGEGKGTVTDFDGKFELVLPAGTYTVQATYVGYQTLSKEVKLVKAIVNIDFLLESESMNEVEIIGDIALERKTPVAFSNITPQRIKEELGTQDLPMILNSTPGIHATQTGGGDGDSRVNIRGFSQRNVAVMVDGIPMNDMENGQVYWSNWFGLDVVTQKIQVQRGLGASKLAIPSVGGTINILSEGIEDKSKIVLSTEYGNNNNTRATVGYNSGRLAGGWGVTSSISAKYNQGWADNLSSKQLFYFLKVSKEMGNQTLSFSVMGSPQQHNQRLGRQPIHYYSRDLAKKLGVDFSNYEGLIADSTYGNYGSRKNPNWGYLERNRFNDQAERDVVADRANYYHKPIMNIKHLWVPNSRFALSNIVYASFGNGGGTGLKGAGLDENGQINFSKLYNDNVDPLFDTPYQLNLVNDTNQYKSTSFLFSNVNNHFWLGGLSTFKWKRNENLEFSGGLDARYYHTDRYQIIYDLLGGDYAVPNASGDDKNNPTDIIKREGDIYGYKIRSYVKQGGVFMLAEYKKGNWSAFLNATSSVNTFSRIDYFALKVNDEYAKSKTIVVPGGTIKSGFNYSINSRHNVFMNAGFISRSQMLSNTFNSRSLDTYQSLENEKVKAAEIGYLYSAKRIRVAANGYYTIWENKPVLQDVTRGTETFRVNIPGMDALHKGGELEIQFDPAKVLQVEAAISYGDWKWINNGSAIVSDEAGAIIDTVSFNADGVRVGDAAQFQSSFALRYSPFKGFYIKPRLTVFDKYYSDFSPESLQDENAGRQSWRIPGYYNFDLNLGYNFSFEKNKQKLGIKLNLMNITNLVYISDARNNDSDVTGLQNFDAASATVYMGMGFRWNVGATYTF
jgi:iron complex outermembrane recepter protein